MRRKVGYEKLWTLRVQSEMKIMIVSGVGPKNKASKRQENNRQTLSAGGCTIKSPLYTSLDRKANKKKKKLTKSTPIAGWTVSICRGAWAPNDMTGRSVVCARTNCCH